MKWGVYDDYSIQSIIPSEQNSILIRVLEPAYKNNRIPYTIKHIDKYTDVLELYFDDIVFEIPEEYKGRFIGFDIDMAEKLIDFINNNDFDEINVHCNKGSSRSSAIMHCVAYILNDKSIINEIEKDSYYNPNKLVLNVFNEFINNKQI